MHSIKVGNKTLNLPILVPSISSFETQLNPVAALKLQITLREPISLVSAFDVHVIGKELSDLSEEFRKSGVLLLDSGGYEHSRIAQYAGPKSPTWDFKNFRAVCEKGIYDFAFSFDYFWCDFDPDETVSQYEARLLTGLSEHDFIPPEKLIPVLHLHARKNHNKRLTEDEILKLIQRIGSETRSPFIAIAERELGQGIVQRFQLAKKICRALPNVRADLGLHVLGCGNLLSFAFLATAGAWMADGLEWYRTFVAENFHLHHFQHEPIILPAKSNEVYNPMASLILSENLSYPLKAATLNLMSLQAFSHSFNASLKAKSVSKFVEKCFGGKAGDKLRELEA
jgi:hypothetical protein